MFPSDRMSDSVSSNWSVIGKGTGSPASLTPMKMYPGARCAGKIVGKRAYRLPYLLAFGDRFFAFDAIRLKVGHQPFEFLNFRHMPPLMRAIIFGLRVVQIIRYTDGLGNSLACSKETSGKSGVPLVRVDDVHPCRDLFVRTAVLHLHGGISARKALQSLKIRYSTPPTFRVEASTEPNSWNPRLPVNVLSFRASKR